MDFIITQNTTHTFYACYKIPAAPPPKARNVSKYKEKQTD